MNKENCTKGPVEECGQILYKDGKPVAVCIEPRYTEHDHEDCKRRKYQPVTA